MATECQVFKKAPPAIALPPKSLHRLTQRGGGGGVSEQSRTEPRHQRGRLALPHLLPLQAQAVRSVHWPLGGLLRPGFEWTALCVWPLEDRGRGWEGETERERDAVWSWVLRQTGYWWTPVHSDAQMKFWHHRVKNSWIGTLNIFRSCSVSLTKGFAFVVSEVLASCSVWEWKYDLFFPPL